MGRANRHLEDAIGIEAEAQLADSYNPRRARALRDEANRLLNQAVELEQQASPLRRDAEEFTSGRRSATADLPGPEDIDQHFAERLTPETKGLIGPDRDAVVRAGIEAHPELIPRLARALLEGEGGGRIVFRVESERSRSLVHVDGQGNVTVEGGASVHLNFGSFERAVEFVLNNSKGKARIIRFEVDENWACAARSAAIPEVNTATLEGQIRLVDVRFADDQLEIPPSLINELNRFIVPGSGVVHEIPARPPSGSAGGELLPPPTGDTPPEAGLLLSVPRGGGTSEPGVPTRPQVGVEPGAQPRAQAAEPVVPQGAQAEAPTRIAPPTVSDEQGLGSRGTAEQTAAGIAGARMAGDAAKQFGLSGANVRLAERAVEQLAAPGGALESRVRVDRQPNGEMQITILGRTSEEAEIPVRLMVKELPRGNGEVPVARYDDDPGTPGGYIITVSEGTPATEVPRALAHELTEIRAKHGTTEKQVHALGSGGSASRLSPHDQGRLAELDVMARQINALAPDHPERRRLLDETQRLAEHLGLLGNTDAAKRRLDIARNALQQPEQALTRALLEKRYSPLLTTRFYNGPSARSKKISALFARQLEHVRALGDNPRALQLREAIILTQAAEAVMRDRLVVQRQTKKGFEPISDGMRIKELRDNLPPDQQSLLGRAVEAAKKMPPLRADDAPTPGYTARFLTKPVAHPEFDLPDDQQLQLRQDKKVETLTVAQAVARRKDLLQQQRPLRDEMAAPNTSEARRAQLKREVEKLIGPINQLSEALGVAAGRRFIENSPELRNGTVLPLPHDGSGVPDLLVELPPHPGGLLVVVECKGGDAELGTRQSADKRLRVQQGRREYLESLAQAMERSKNPTIQTYGKRLRLQLANKDQKTRYFLVQQRFDIDDNPTSPEVSEFDIGS